MKIINFFNNIWAKAGGALIASNHEPQVELKCDRYGNKYWQAHDLHSNKFYTFSSEQEIRIWLENRYHCFN